ncbi:hypothetical protein HBN50_02120 [Halobacteriovorax sp. GB3]|uniref:hypothetical protein n=1 Tax=Halobacteriovorax sp. GB3 TaxID=2719615 RepID=UPI00235DC84B|nr:hypothetical protein [Halobacteriovorax sp. GB3]MDD0851868.1 hypothetical protein [Halobacteriovorax sp. GB3]
MIRFLLWDMAFNLFKIDIKERHRYLIEKSKKMTIDLGRGVIFKYGKADYVRFREQVENFSLDIIAWSHSENLRFHAYKNDTYIPFLMVMEYAKKTNLDCHSVFKEILEISLWDKSYNTWRVPIVNSFESKLLIPKKESIEIKKDVLNEFHYVREDYSDEFSFFMAMATALLAEGKVDKKEKEVIQYLFCDHLKSLKSSVKGQLNYLHYITGRHQLSKDEQEKVMAFCSTLITCDGEISKKEVALFEIFQKEFQLGHEDLKNIKQYSGMSIEDIFYGSSPKLISYALYFGLLIIASDDKIHEKELSLIKKVHTIWQCSKKDRNDEVFHALLWVRFIAKRGIELPKFYQIIKDSLFVNEDIFNTARDFLLLLDEGEGDKRRLWSKFLLKTQKYLPRTYEVQRDYKTYNELLSFCTFALEYPLKEKMMGLIKKQVKEVLYQLDQSDIEKYLSVVFDMVLLDGKVELLEDQFVIDLCCHYDISDEHFRRELFFSSFIHSSQMVISEFINYSLFKKV